MKIYCSRAIPERCLLGVGRHQVRAAAQQKSKGIPYEVIKPASSRDSYELRLYQPRFIVEMPYKSRQTAYMAFDNYLTGALDVWQSLAQPPDCERKHHQGFL